mgnify:CR=1 FL=1
MAAASLKKPKLTIGGLIDQMSALREERRKLDAQSTEVQKVCDALEIQLIELMDAEGATKSTGHVASASIAETVEFNTQDWDSFMAYVAKTKQFHLVQRRVSAPSVRELFESKGKVPGLEPYTKRKISLRNI